jgi:hypothetical protein
MVGLYEGAAFLTQRIPLKGKLIVGVTKVDTSSTSTNGAQQEYHRLERSVVELVKKLSGSAPADVQRTLLGLVTRRYNGVLQSRELGTITLSKLNTSWSPELNSFCKVTTGGNFTFEAPPDGGAPDSNNSSDAESRNESTDARLMSVEINEVRFSGTGYHQLKSDDGQTTYDAPQWKDVNGDGKGITDAQSGDKGYPVAYTKGSLPSIGAALKITGMITGQSYEMKATSSQGVEIPPTPITIATDGSVVLPPTPASKGFADKIEFHDARDNTAFQLDWHVKVGTSNWAKIGSTKHTVYLTLAAPITTAAGLMRETLFNIGCRTAKGINDEAQAVDVIYGEFKNRAIYKVKPSSGELSTTKMTYWGDPSLNPAGTTTLLNTNDGTCEAWSCLFIDVLRTQGIANVSQVVITPPDKTRDEMKNQHQTDFPNLPEPLIGTVTAGIAVKVCSKVPNGRSDGWFTPSTTPNGLPGQGGMPSPSRKLFTNHAVVIYSGKLYDPSYGSPVISPVGNSSVIELWENESIQWLLIQMKGSQDTVSDIWTYLQNPSAQDCTTDNTGY